MRKLLVKYSLLCLTVLCFSVFSEDTTSTTDSSTSQTTGDSADTSSTTDSSTESTTTDTTSDTTTDSSASTTGANIKAGTVIINVFNTSQLELTKTSSTLEGSCWGSGAPDTITANGKITFSTLPNCAKDKSNARLVYESPTSESFTISLGGIGTNDRAIAATSSSDQYNIKYVEDVDRDDDQVQVNYFVTPVSTPTTFSIVVGSDPQAWRLNNNADPNNNQGSWEAYVRNVVTGIRRIVANSYMIINGDITEYGRDSQRESYDAIFGALQYNYYWGLGNHDYANNVGDCTDWPDLSYNACARHSVDAMGGAIRNYYVNMLPEVDYDWNVDPYSGSLAYAWSYGNIRFIQLQNYPTYSVLLDHWANVDKNITPSLGFLYWQILKARDAGKVAVVNMHDYSDHFRSNSTAAQRDEFKFYMNNYPVLAVFAGHTHQAGVFNRNGGDSFFGRVPVYNSGALFKGDFLMVNFYDKCLYPVLRNGENGGVTVISTYGQLCMSDVEGNTRAMTTEEEAKVKASIATEAEVMSAAKTAKTVQTAEEIAKESVQIATRGENSLCLAAVAGANATLDDCSKPETFFNLEERSRGYNKFVSAADTSLCLKTSVTDDTITLAACKGDNSVGDLTSLRLWQLPNNQEGYLFKNKYKEDQCVQATGDSAKVAEIANCANNNADLLTSQQWVLKRDNFELQPAEESGQ